MNPAMSSVVPVEIADEVNAKILAVSEDQLQGFQRDPFGVVAERTGLAQSVVLERVRAMLEAGVIRRIRQTLLATNLAKGALVAWEVAQDDLDAAFDYMFQEDPFSGHVVTRSTDTATAGSNYKLWTTLKVPQGFSLEKHCEVLKEKVGAKSFRIMPAKKIFALGVGHVRRKDMEPGARSEEPGKVNDVAVVDLTDHEWRIMEAVKREFAPEELVEDLWNARAAEANVSLEEFFKIAEDLNERRVVGRFSTFLEHVKKLSTDEQVTRYNALFHWAVPVGRELEAGREVGRHYIMTHAYWREGGPEFRNVNVMGVAHGTDKAKVLAHKAAIDQHLAEAGIEISYTNVFWGGRSEIKPSEISPLAYEKWCAQHGIEMESMMA
ncbi:MAG TPA: Lrp/AsnC family transcriptional regulator [Verrucomicrobia bacterium]|nr:Lrp/AsnC family transcriptional regulator [Verrucomicrobiota bacterium]